MKRPLLLISLLGILFFTGVAALAQDDEPATTTATATDEGGPVNILKKKFIEGDPRWMTPILVCLVFGLALCIERIITLNLSTTNTNQLVSRVDNALKGGNVNGAKEICKSTPGPVASVLHAGLDRIDEGVEIIEKSIVSYGSVQTGMLERGLVWISLFISIAPMLGFMGTVIGMIDAFDKIEAAGEIRATDVAGGIKIALLTTVFGLIVAIILQLFYNYIISKIDNLVNSMEDASIALVDSLVRHNIVKS